MDTIQGLGLRHVRVVEPDSVFVDETQTICGVLEIAILVVDVTQTSGEEVDVRVLGSGVVDLTSPSVGPTIDEPNEALFDIERQKQAVDFALDRVVGNPDSQVRW